MLNKVIQNPGKMYRFLKIFAVSLPMLLFACGKLLDLLGNNNDDPIFAISTCHNCLGGLVMVSPDEGWAPGAKNMILHYHHGAWTWEALPLDDQGSIVALAMAAPDDGWALASEPTPGGSNVATQTFFLRYHAGHWQNTHQVALNNLAAITMLSPTDGWSVGEQGTFMHYDGQQWKVNVVLGYGELTAISMASATDGWAVGDDGLALHYQGGHWLKVPTPDDTPSFEGVAIQGTNDIWASAFHSPDLYHYDGQQWQTVSIIPSPEDPDGFINISLINADWAVGEIPAPSVNPYDALLLPAAILHNEDHQWRTTNLFHSGIWAQQFMRPDEIWGSGKVHQFGADQGVIGHYVNGVWRITYVPREPELLWITLLRYGVGFVILAEFFFLIRYLVMTFLPAIRAQLRAAWLVRLGLLCGMVALGGNGSISLEPLLFPYYNEDFRHIALIIGMVGIALGFACLFATFFVNRTPKPAPVPADVPSIGP